jgi:hypothetical protein
MAISHELSSDIAAAILAAQQKHPRDLRDLKEIVFQVHATLQQLTAAAQRERVLTPATCEKTGSMLCLVQTANQGGVPD